MRATVHDQVGFSRRAALALAGGAVGAAALPSMSNAIAAPATQAAPGSQVFFGWVLGSANIIAVAFDLAAPDDAGTQVVKAYVCDGLGLPDGIALWFKGSVSAGEELTLSAADGPEQILITAVNPTGVYGAFTGQDKATYRFAAFRAIDGAGIYDVTLDADLRYAGTSTDGSTLAAQATEDGLVTGTITTVGGTEITFTVHVLSRLSEKELVANGLPIAMREYADVSIVPDSYTAVISPGGTFWLGRSGDVRAGSPGLNIIGLDMCD